MTAVPRPPRRKRSTATAISPTGRRTPRPASVTNARSNGAVARLDASDGRGRWAPPALFATPDGALSHFRGAVTACGNLWGRGTLFGYAGIPSRGCEIEPARLHSHGCGRRPLCPAGDRHQLGLARSPQRSEEPAHRP